MHYVFQLSVSVAMAAWSIAVCVAGPAIQRTQPFADEAGERESQDFNEVGPAEDWKLLQRLTKTNAFDPEDTEKTRTLMKEIEEFQRIAMAVNDTATDRNEDETTTAMGDDGGAVTETEPASSDWASTWRSAARGGDGDDRDAFERQESEDGNFEEIIRKISNDLKKLYVKIKQVMSVVKNWYALWNVANTVLAAAGWRI